MKQKPRRSEEESWLSINNWKYRTQLKIIADKPQRIALGLPYRAQTAIIQLVVVTPPDIDTFDSVLSDMISRDQPTQ